MNLLLLTLLLGVGATLIMDAAALILRRLAGVPAPDYRLVGRWVGHMARGRLRHRSIAGAPAVHGERMLGWLVHYAVGIAFAGLLLAVVGLPWLHAPTLAPALAVGIGTVVAPFLLMQPAMGLGLAARRAPSPWAARRRSLFNHALFGAGLYLAARALATVLA